MLFRSFISQLCNIVSIAAGNCHSLALSVDGDVYGFGWNDMGQLGLGDNNDRFLPTLISGLANVSRITANVNSLFLTIDNRLYGCGHNKYWQLGLQDNDNRNVPTLLLDI